jgi:hypothetical protein
VHAEQAPPVPLQAMQCASAAAAVEQQAVLHVAGLLQHAWVLHVLPGFIVAWHVFVPSR